MSQLQLAFVATVDILCIAAGGAMLLWCLIVGVHKLLDAICDWRMTKSRRMTNAVLNQHRITPRFTVPK